MKKGFCQNWPLLGTLYCSMRDIQVDTFIHHELLVWIFLNESFFCFKIMFWIFFIHITESVSKWRTVFFISPRYKFLILTNIELVIPSVVREIRKPVYKALLDTFITIHKKSSIWKVLLLANRLMLWPGVLRFLPLIHIYLFSWIIFETTTFLLTWKGLKLVSISRFMLVYFKSVLYFPCISFSQWLSFYFQVTW